LKNNDTIINNIKCLIATEVQTALERLRQDFDHKNKEIVSQQEVFNNELQRTNLKIKELEKENATIKSQLRDIQTSLTNKQNVNSRGEESQKKFIIYGLDEFYGESESDIIQRIDCMFRDILNININGFIETVKRIGKKGNRRPLIIELISKRMKTYVLDNAFCFKNSGYAVSEVLDTETLKKRKILREHLYKARRDGKHAVLRNNRLFVNGAEFIPKLDNDSHLSQRNTVTDTQANSNQDIAEIETVEADKNNVRSDLFRV
jgi:hypothetical protein